MSMKSAVKDHVTNSPITEHFKRHGWILSYVIPHEESSSIQNGLGEESTFRRRMELKKFSELDLNNCSKLYKEVFSDEPWNDEWITISQVRSYLKQLIKNPVFRGYVVYQDSKLVAACLGHERSWWDGNEFFIDEFFVSSEFQGRGIGSLLMNYVEKHPEMKDINSFHLLTNNDVPAKNFYVKNGFKSNNKRIIMKKKFF